MVRCKYTISVHDERLVFAGQCIRAHPASEIGMNIDASAFRKIPAVGLEPWREEAW